MVGGKATLSRYKAREELGKAAASEGTGLMHLDLPDLPSDIWRAVLEFLPRKDLIVMGFTSKVGGSRVFPPAKMRAYSLIQHQRQGLL